MSKKRDKDGIIYGYNPDGPNVITDELSATSFMALREVHWLAEDPYHLDFRRYFVKPDGQEMPGKGTSIPNPQALINAMLGSGYGDTKECVNALWERDDMVPAIGAQVAKYDEEQYEGFKSDLDDARNKAIEEMGAVMSSSEFMENL